MVKVAQSFPFVKSFGGRAGSMELASSDLWDALRKLSVEQLKLLKPTREYQPLIDALIDVRGLMGE